jgi:hypothetical protein
VLRGRLASAIMGAMAGDEQGRQLLPQMRALSAADLSVLHGVVASLATEEEVRVTTTPGSDNDRLWSEMTKLGWMSADAPLEVPVASKVFVVHAAAKDALEALLIEIQRDALPQILSELRRDMPPKIARPVIAAGGTPADVALMLAGIVEATMRRWIKPELHEDFLDDIVKKVRLISKEPKA